MAATTVVAAAAIQSGSVPPEFHWPPGTGPDAKPLKSSSAGKSKEDPVTLDSESESGDESSAAEEEDISASPANASTRQNSPPVDDSTETPRVSAAQSVAKNGAGGGVSPTVDQQSLSKQGSSCDLEVGHLTGCSSTHPELNQRSSAPIPATPATPSPATSRDQPSFEERGTVSVQEGASEDEGGLASSTRDGCTLGPLMGWHRVSLAPLFNSPTASAPHQDQPQSHRDVESRADSGPSGNTFNRGRSLPDRVNPTEPLFVERNQPTNRVENSLQDESRPPDPAAGTENDRSEGRSESEGELSTNNTSRSLKHLSGTSPVQVPANQRRGKRVRFSSPLEPVASVDDSSSGIEADREPAQLLGFAKDLSSGSETTDKSATSSPSSTDSESDTPPPKRSRSGRSPRTQFERAKVPERAGSDGRQQSPAKQRHRRRRVRLSTPPSGCALIEGPASGSEPALLSDLSEDSSSDSDTAYESATPPPPAKQRRPGLPRAEDQRAKVPYNPQTYESKILESRTVKASRGRPRQQYLVQAWVDKESIEDCGLLKVWRSGNDRR